LFGEVHVFRKGYSLPSHNSLFPLDSTLNLPPTMYSHGLRKRIAVEAAKSSFDEVTEAINQTTGGHVPKRQAEYLLSDITIDFDSFYESRRFESSENTNDILVVTTDGKGIVMIKKALREATRLAAEQNKSSHARLKPGEKNNQKRMSTVAAIYSVAPYVRTAEQIMPLDKNNNSQKIKADRPKPYNKRVFASLVQKPFYVLGEMFAEAFRRDPDQKRPWVLLVDGGEHQLALAEDIITEAKFNVTIILDIIHVIEYIWRAAHCFFQVGSEKAEQWVRKQVFAILSGKAGQVASSMKRRATKLEYSLSQRKGIDKCAAYLQKYKDFLAYDQYLAAGFPIATGVIEGACRYLIKDRMDITGARWGLQTAEAVLKVRALRASGDFEEYWCFHLDREHKRHYPTFSDEYNQLSQVA
ncbi:MAG: ISKra4 family transposase, partial [Desulfobacterales bacterium]